MSQARAQRVGQFGGKQQFVVPLAAPARAERATYAARPAQLGMEVDGDTPEVAYSVEECNAHYKPLAEAFAAANSVGNTKLMADLRPKLDLWSARIAAAAAAGANVAPKREAADDNGDVSAAKTLKTASGAPARTVPSLDAARAAGVHALTQRHGAKATQLQAGLVSVLTPVVAAGVKALPSSGTNLRQAVHSVALAHGAAAVKDMAAMPGEPGEKMALAFTAAMTVAEKVSKVGCAPSPARCRARRLRLSAPAGQRPHGEARREY